MKYFLILIVSLIVPFMISAQDQELINPLGSTSTVWQVLEAISGFLMWVGAPIAVIMILWGAFQMITAAGNPEKIETGKRTIWWAIIGLIVILLSSGIIYAITNFFGADTPELNPITPQ